MGKLALKGLVGIVIVLGAIYVLIPNGANATSKKVATTKTNTQYVSLESKSSNTNVQNVPNGFTMKVSTEAQNSGVATAFESALKNKYINDGNVEIYISQASGSLGGPEQITYDVNINGQETYGLTAKRNVTNPAYGSYEVSMSSIIWGNQNSSN